MSILGFPSEQELTSMMGFVTDKDRDEWDARKDASDRRLESARSGLTAKGLASKSATPAVSMIERTVNSQMTAAQMEARRNTSPKQTRRTVTTLETEEPVQSDGYGMGY
jgi:hypothetical protein